jgi:zinc D-Ala-D-Ala carboxypeptidase
MLNLTDHFMLEEFIMSDYAVRNGIDNTPEAQQIVNIKRLCEKILEPLRIKIGMPIHISSGYRCPELNIAIGGAKNSQHQALNDEAAADTIVSGITVQQWFDFIIMAGIYFDQLILEFDSWVHISWSQEPRHEILIARKVDGKTIYKAI